MDEVKNQRNIAEPTNCYDIFAGEWCGVYGTQNVNVNDEEAARR